MNVKFVGGTGKCLEMGKSTPHQDNINHLGRNPVLKNKIDEAVFPRVVRFLKDYRNRPCMNSGSEAITVCEMIGIPNNEINHGLVGSSILEAFKAIDPSSLGIPKQITVIACKNEEWHCFNYFLDVSSVSAVA